MAEFKAEPMICLWQVNGCDCGEKATTRITVKDRTGSARIPVCAEHKAEHNRKAAQFRVKG